MNQDNKKPLSSEQISTGLKHTEFPKYPLYGNEDDIMSRSERVETNLDDRISPVTDTRLANDEIDEQENKNQESFDQVVPVDEFTVTAEDLEVLGSDDLNADDGDDEQLKHRTAPVDFAATDLDVPGSELDDAAEEVGSEDEENNSYSIGGDNHDDLEESKP